MNRGYYVSGMTCDGCAEAVTEAGFTVAGVAR